MERCQSTLCGQHTAATRRHPVDLDLFSPAAEGDGCGACFMVVLLLAEASE